MTEAAPLRVISLFSGVGGVELGLHAAGMTTVALCEIEPYARRILAKRFKGVRLHDDVRTFTAERGSADVVAGGSPCQDVSVAGKRAGLAGERSGLFYELVRVADLVAPDVVLFENVAGLLSSNDGEDFAVVLGELTGFRPVVPLDGWRSAGVCTGPKRTAAWRMLDARYFGVPQRRRRVFVVASPRAERAVSLLSQSESRDRDSAAQRAARPRAAGGFGDGIAAPVLAKRGTRMNGTDETYVPDVAYAVSVHGTSGISDREGVTTLIAAPLTAGGHPKSNAPGRRREDDENIVAFAKSKRAATSDDDETWVPADVANTLNAFDAGDVRTTHAIVETAHTLRGVGFDASEDGTGRGTPIIVEQPTVAYSMRSDASRDGVAKTPSADADGNVRLRNAGLGIYKELAPTLDAGAAHSVAQVPADDADPLTAFYSHTGQNQTYYRDESPPVTASYPPSVMKPHDAEPQALTSKGNGEAYLSDHHGSLTSGGGGQAGQGYPAAMIGSSVRRLTPTECERLMGWPDGWTCAESDFGDDGVARFADGTPYSTERCKCPDGPRYQVIGNGVVAPCAEWIGRQIIAAAS